MINLNGSNPPASFGYKSPNLEIRLKLYEHEIQKSNATLNRIHINMALCPADSKWRWEYILFSLEYLTKCIDLYKETIALQKRVLVERDQANVCS